MKKKFFLLILILLLTVPAAVLAEENGDTKAEAEVKVQLGNFSYNDDNQQPYASPGPSGGFIQSYFPIENGEDGYGLYYSPNLDGVSQDELSRLMSPGRVKGKINFRVPSNNYPIRLLDELPKKMRLLGWFTAKSGKDEIKLPVIARALYHARLKTNMRYALVEVYFKKEPTMKGISIGGGAAKNLGLDAAGSVGTILGWSSAKHYRLTTVKIFCYGGNKNLLHLPWEAGEDKNGRKPKRAKEILAEKTVPKAREARQINWSFDGQPIFFNFDVDIPKAGQETMIVKWASYIGGHLDDLLAGKKEIEIRGYCDIRGGENYNSQLGFRRSRNVMYPIISLLVDAGKKKGIEQTRIIEACQKIVRAVSASNLNPHFTEADGLAKKQTHQLNRRVDLILVNKNLTVGNIPVLKGGTGNEKK